VNVALRYGCVHPPGIGLPVTNVFRSIETVAAKEIRGVLTTDTTAAMTKNT
jgi:hypothetical protein